MCKAAGTVGQCDRLRPNTDGVCVLDAAGACECTQEVPGEPVRTGCSLFLFGCQRRCPDQVVPPPSPSERRDASVKTILSVTLREKGHHTAYLLLFQLGRHPEQWDLVRNEPALVPRAIDEALRLESPVHAFTRVAVEHYEVDGTVIPAGERVLVMYAAANRDERRYPDPDRFDVTQDAKYHVGFGHDVHRCAGSYLAELEMPALLRAMAARVRRIEVGEPAVALNNVLRGYGSFGVSFLA
jgi:hypothetical protein